MHYLRLLRSFIHVSLQEELSYRANFFISLLNSLLNFALGVIGVLVLFGQVKAIHGWTLASTLSLLGTYLILSAARAMVIGPSLDALAGLGGHVWQGTLDFTLLRPVNTQFLASFRRWRILPVIDLLLGAGVLLTGIIRYGQTISMWHGIEFLLTLITGGIVLYAILLAFTSLVFWSAGFFFTWVFDGLFQLARYPVGLYPGWARLALTWIIPIGIMTTVPAQALNGDLPTTTLIASILFALALLIAASLFFRIGLRHYASASS